MSLVREDEKGLYIWLNGGKHRPGKVAGYSHVFDMSDGELEAGNKVKTSVISQTPLIRIQLDDGCKLYWHRDD